MDESAAPSLLDLHPSAGSFLDDVRAGLESEPRTLPCKYFYDARGSQLFDRITELDEYYPARTEVGILESNMDDIVESLEDDPLVIEFGSGNSSKTRLLLDHLPDAAGYVPVDISREHLVDAAARLQARYPELEILPVCADFTEPIPIPEPKRPPGHRVVFFPGSTIGNFTRDEARDFLRTVTEDCGDDGGLLIGVDLRKDPERLERAYDDREGVTAAFNLNLLDRINRELGADFDVEGFRHRAVWNPAKGRVEMHLESLRDQEVHLDGRTYRFAAGETIHTENSHKYEVEEFAAMAHEVGLELAKVWTDPDRQFSVHLYWVDRAA
jgi:dimethylhistidine N-methyltransferase